MGVTVGGVDQHCSTAHSAMEYTHHQVSERVEKKTERMQTIFSTAVEELKTKAQYNILNMQ